MHNQLSIHFGPFTLAFSTSSNKIYAHLEQFFNGYIAKSPPDVTIHVIPSGNLPDPKMQMTQDWAPCTCDTGGFDIGPRIITGSLNFRENSISISMREDFFSFPTANVFQIFLYRLYHTMCLEKSIKSYFIHGCGIIRDNRGYLFIGPHQSGKTTIGQLSNATVIHDDQILIRLDGATLTMDSPPLAAKNNLRCRPEKPCPVENIFVIKKNTAYAVTVLDAQVALATLYNEIVAPVNLVSGNHKESLKQKAAVCFNIIKQVTLYELHFDKTGGFRELLARI